MEPLTVGVAIDGDGLLMRDFVGMYYRKHHNNIQKRSKLGVFLNVKRLYSNQFNTNLNIFIIRYCFVVTKTLCWTKINVNVDYLIAFTAKHRFEGDCCRPHIRQAKYPTSQKPVMN